MRRLADRFRLWRWRLAGRAVTEPSCRRCGYPVRGLTGGACPECGADRARVGVVEPMRPLGVWVWAWLAGWLGVVLVAALLLNDTLLPLTPRDTSYHEDYVVTPASGLYGSFTVRRIGYGWGFAWRDASYPDTPRGAWLWDRVDGQPDTAFGDAVATGMEVNPHAGTGYYYWNALRPGAGAGGGVSAPVNVRGPVDGAFVLRWLGDLGVDTARADVQAEAAELAAMMLTPTFRDDPLAHLQSLSAARVGGGREIVPPYHGQWCVNGFWAVVAVVGGVAIAWRCRRGGSVRR